MYVIPTHSRFDIRKFHGKQTFFFASFLVKIRFDTINHGTRRQRGADLPVPLHPGPLPLPGAQDCQMNGVLNFLIAPSDFSVNILMTQKYIFSYFILAVFWKSLLVHFFYYFFRGMFISGR